MRRYTGKPILVPLTSSLYVPGKLADTNNVIVDVGTGFYVEKVCYLADTYRLAAGTETLADRCFRARKTQPSSTMERWRS